MIPRHIFLKIEALASYSPVAPVPCGRRYGRDCMFNQGHTLGRVDPRGITEATLDALVTTSTWTPATHNRAERSWSTLT